MKKFTIFLLVALTTLAISTTVLAASPQQRQLTCPRQETCQFIDKNNDSICDNRINDTCWQTSPNRQNHNCDGTQIRQHQNRRYNQNN